MKINLSPPCKDNLRISGRLDNSPTWEMPLKLKGTSSGIEKQHTFLACPSGQVRSSCTICLLCGPLSPKGQPGPCTSLTSSHHFLVAGGKHCRLPTMPVQSPLTSGSLQEQIEVKSYGGHETSEFGRWKEEITNTNFKFLKHWLEQSCPATRKPNGTWCWDQIGFSTPFFMHYKDMLPRAPLASGMWPTAQNSAW